MFTVHLSQCNDFQASFTLIHTKQVSLKGGRGWKNRKDLSFMFWYSATFLLRYFIWPFSDIILNTFFKKLTIPAWGKNVGQVGMKH